MFSSSSRIFLSALLLLSSSFLSVDLRTANASPVQPELRDVRLTELTQAEQVHPTNLIVFNPPITSPKASVAWARGSQQVVKWETKGIPPQRLNTTGLLLLGHWGGGSENLDISHPLASNFAIHTGSVKVKMPANVPARDDYFVVLFGDSGNKSPKFKIH